MEINIICVSYAQTFATTLHNQTRQILQAPWFQAAFPETRIGPWKDTGQEVILEGNGSRLATSIGGTLTGRGADILIIDDPINAADASSDAQRRKTNDWITGTTMSRLNDKVNGAVVLIMQRFHVDDPVGHMLERDPRGWTVLNLPAIAPFDMTIATGWNSTHLFREGDVLHPAREPLDVLEQQRRLLGSEAFEAQYLQNPTPIGGNIIKRDWLAYYDDIPDFSRAEIIQSWDTASKTGNEHDYSVCTTWAFVDGHWYLIDLFRDKLDYHQLLPKALDLAAKHKPRQIFVEDTGIGTVLIADLKRDRQSAIGIKPTDSKVVRMYGHTPKFEAGRVRFPRKAPWLDAMLNELLGFPQVRHDDQVDSISQALSQEPQKMRFTRWVNGVKITT